MKKLLFIFLLSGCAVPHYNNIREVNAAIRPYDIKAVEWFFSNQISYWRDYDDNDENKPSNKTIHDRLGDCEDFAILAMDIVNTWPGCEARIMRRGERHVVALVSCDNGIYGYFEEGSFKKL